MMDIQRLLEKYYPDIRHIETERHWFLGAYAVVVAGVLAFLAQNSITLNFIFGFGALWILAVFGFLHGLRSAWILELLQNEAKDIVICWRDNPEGNNTQWIERWMWPSQRGKKPKRDWWSDLLCDLKRPPPSFTSVSLWVYVVSFCFFASFFGLNVTIYF
jgi:hypothetical protein